MESMFSVYGNGIHIFGVQVMYMWDEQKVHIFGVQTFCTRANVQTFCTNILYIHLDIRVISNIELEWPQMKNLNMNVIKIVIFESD